MAYGMRSSELAAVGRNVNNQGKGVSEDSIAAALDDELTQERKETVSRNKARATDAKAKDAAQKAQLKSNMIQAVVDSAIQVGGHMASTPQAQAKQAAKGAEKAAIKESKLGSKVKGLEGDPTQAKKLARVKKRHGKAIQRSSAASKRADLLQKKAYGSPGSLYGGTPVVDQPEIPQPAVKPVITV